MTYIDQKPNLQHLLLETLGHVFDDDWQHPAQPQPSAIAGQCAALTMAVLERYGDGDLTCRKLIRVGKALFDRIPLVEALAGPLPEQVGSMVAQVVDFLMQATGERVVLERQNDNFLVTLSVCPCCHGYQRRHTPCFVILGLLIAAVNKATYNDGPGAYSECEVACAALGDDACIFQITRIDQLMTPKAPLSDRIAEPKGDIDVAGILSHRWDRC